MTRAVEPRTPITSARSVADRLADALPAGEVGDFDVSGLDRLGVPVISADHLGAGWPRAAAVGYGATVEQARTGAYGELAEALLLHGHLRTMTPRRASYRELRGAVGAHGVVDPRSLVLPAGTVVDDDQPRSWLPTLRWRTGETVLVPAEFCAADGADLPWQDPAERLIPVITNGSGAGDTVERAVAHGLLELLQRDGNTTAFRAMDAGVVIDVDEVHDPVIRLMLDRLADAGIEVLPKLASTAFGMPDVHVVGIDRQPETPALAVTACGEAVHPDREVALRKALLEYVSSRSRKVFSHAPLDLLRPVAPQAYWRREFARPAEAQESRAITAMRGWTHLDGAQLLALLEPVVLARRDSVPLSALPTVAPGSLDDQGALLAELLRRLADFDVLVVVAPGEGATVAKVIVPGLEAETMSYGRIAARGIERLRERDSPLVGLGTPPHAGAAPVVLDQAGRERLGAADAWLDLAAVARTIGPLYPLYREPTRHAVQRSGR
ncbi:ribosomal protein S12 methylthiotransferase accessory factor [Micromonospora sediminicola]|uniref:Ribosomal protein S12 methylthiotransferase accessory factor n=1 Tax=Micromonospora sediminicola TaxID=946078 RepID=A0A1A9BA21_9ACTN|nr:YcaO-like family protein [Micromonospora sediminicola]SBT65824.1 ribosomal protein S12 methylthiotransferase accessory factor [Micromonospora sediminicola]